MVFSSSSTRRPPPSLPPEVLAEIGHNLTLSELVSGVLVSRQWCSIFVSFPWHTIDDRLLFKVEDCCDALNVCSAPSPLEERARVLPLKYGHHSRCLTGSNQSTMLILASEPKACTRFQSLVINSDKAHTF